MKRTNKKHRGTARGKKPKVSKKLVLVDDNGKPLAKGFIQKAQAEYATIVESIQQISQSWIKLQLHIKRFREKGYFRAIINPATQKPYTNWADCLGHLFGKSQSTMFRDQRLLRELEGTVDEASLTRMSKENIEGIVTLKSKVGAKALSKVVTISGERMTVLEAAEKLPSKTFHERVVIPNLPEDQRPEALEKFVISELTPSEFKEVERTFQIAAWQVKQADAATEEHRPDYSESLRKKSFLAICAEFRSTYEANFEEYQRMEEERLEANQQHGEYLEDETTETVKADEDDEEAPPEPARTEDAPDTEGPQKAAASR